MIIKIVDREKMGLLLSDCEDENFKGVLDWEMAANRFRDCLQNLPLKRFYVSPAFTGGSRIGMNVDEGSISQHVIASLVDCYKKCPKSIEIAWRYRHGVWQGWVLFSSGNVYLEENGFPWDLAALHETAEHG